MEVQHHTHSEALLPQGMLASSDLQGASVLSTWQQFCRARGHRACLQAVCASEDHTAEMFRYGPGMSLSPQGSQFKAEACE